MKRSKEVDNIIKSIEKYIHKHKGQVSFVGSMTAFNKQAEVVDDLLLGYGTKETIKVQLKEVNDWVKKEKGKFINW